MSVHALYKGRTGNNLFQYVWARLFAEAQGLAFYTPPPVQEVLSVVPAAVGQHFDGPNVFITDNSGDVLSRDGWAPARYLFDDWFQHSEWFIKRRARIMEILRPRPVEKQNTEDIVINLRVADDYRSPGWVIHPRWYLDILEKERFGKLHIVADVRDEGYLARFARYDPVVVSSGPNGDWEYLRSFSRIVCSNSTFCWWAAFLSEAAHIWTFRRWIRHSAPRIGPFPNGTAVDGPFLDEA